MNDMMPNKLAAIANMDAKYRGSCSLFNFLSLLRFLKCEIDGFIYVTLKPNFSSFPLTMNAIIEKYRLVKMAIVIKVLYRMTLI